MGPEARRSHRPWNLFLDTPLKTPWAPMRHGKVMTLAAWPAEKVALNRTIWGRFIEGEVN
jgi:hypothetical protein